MLKTEKQPLSEAESQAATRLLDLFAGNTRAAQEALTQISPHAPPPDKHRPSPISADAPVIVQLDDVTKTYRVGGQKISALTNVSTQIRQGEFVALTGPSGSGKSTLLQLIGGLDKPTTGTIQVSGHEIGHLNDRELSRFRNQTIGFVFQFFYLQPFLTIATNLEIPAMFARVGRAQRRTKALELAAAVGLTERTKHLPKELSGGQMQRAAIARALSNTPKLLLADEPTGNLDQANGQAIIELFEQVRRDFGTTIIIVTHDHSIARKADREIRLTDGRIINS